MRGLVLIVLFACFLVVGSCTTSDTTQLEFINPPVNATLTDKGSYHELTFNAYNIETDFAGYGLFTGTGTEAEAKAAALAKISSATTSSDAELFCSNGASFEKTYVVQLGGSSLVDGVDCPTSADDLSKITVSSVKAISISARVDRDSDTWSEAAIVIVP